VVAYPMPQQLTLELVEYEALVALARRGTIDSERNPDPNKMRELESFLKSIEKNNDITRYFLAVRWQELNEPLPQGTRFPTDWPPTLEDTIQLTTRPIAKVDVTDLIAAQAKNAQNIMVTTDPGMVLGWTAVDDYFA